MDKNKASEMIQSAQKKVELYFPQYKSLINDISVYLSSSKDKLQTRNQIAREIGAKEETEINDIAGQGIIGKNHYAIIMFFEEIQSFEFTHYLYHEFGHIISIVSCKDLFNEAELEINEGKETLLRKGISIWSEFIAEVIAYRVEEAEPLSLPWVITDKLEALMDKAVNDKYFDFYPFAFYCAIFLEDPTIDMLRYEHPCAAFGADNCDDKIMPYIEKALNILATQLGKEEFWMIDKTTVCDLGKCHNDLWNYCKIQNIDRIVEYAISNNKHLFQMEKINLTYEEYFEKVKEILLSLDNE